MIVKPLSIQIWMGIGREQKFFIFADAVVICEHIEIRRVMHEQLPIDVSQPKHRMQIRGKHRDVPIGMKTQNAIARGITRQPHINRILRHKNPPIRRATNDARMNQLRWLRNKRNGPTGLGLRKCRISRFSRNNRPRNKTNQGRSKNDTNTSSQGKGMHPYLMAGHAPFFKENHSLG